MDINILIRFDDICPTMDWVQWGRAEELLNKYGAKPLIGVIPDCKDPDLLIDAPRPDFWEWVKKKQSEGYAIAMHGFNHVFCSPCHGILNYRMDSEFAGLPYDEQLAKIRKGKEILESHGIQTDIFFAPAHSYDENTIKALFECGFKYVSDGKSSNAYEWHGIKFLPCRNPGSARIKGNGYYTSIYHAHEWVRKDKAEDYDLFYNLLDKYHDSIVELKEYCQQSISSTLFMRFYEGTYIRFEHYLLPTLRKIKRALKK